MTHHPTTHRGIVSKSAHFSNFAQRVKMEYWNGEEPIEKFIAESDLDEILLLAWSELSSQKQTLKQEILRELEECKMPSEPFSGNSFIKITAKNKAIDTCIDIINEVFGEEGE